MVHSGVSSGGTGSKLRPLNRCWKKTMESVALWNFAGLESLFFISSFYSQHPRHSKGWAVEEEFKMCGIFLRMKISNDFSFFWISVLLRFSCFYPHILSLSLKHETVNRRGDRSSATSVGQAHPLLRTSQRLLFGPFDKTCREEKVNEKGWEISWNFSPYFQDLQGSNFPKSVEDTELWLATWFFEFPPGQSGDQVAVWFVGRGPAVSTNHSMQVMFWLSEL